MLSLRQHISILISAAALVFSTSASAGLYGFSSTDAKLTAVPIIVPPRHIKNYRKDIRDLVIELAQYGKSRNHNFKVLTHEGQYLLDKSLWEYHLKGYNKIRRKEGAVDDFSFLSPDIPENDEDKPLEIDRYIAAIDGIVVNNHYCQNAPLDSAIKKLKIPVFSIEHCADDEALDSAIKKSLTDKIAIYPFLHKTQAFKKISRQLIINETPDSISTPSEARNVSFLIDDSRYNTPYQMLEDIRRSNYDIVVIRPLFHEDHPFTKDDIASLKFKLNGGNRLILALYNISEIATTDYLWQKQWNRNPPHWIATKSFVTGNAFITKYWTPEWKALSAKYFKSIVDTGYDGVFLTGIENHSYFEHNQPLE